MWLHESESNGEGHELFVVSSGAKEFNEEVAGRKQIAVTVGSLRPELRLETRRLVQGCCSITLLVRTPLLKTLTQIKE